jgi:hypothetical protein
MMFLNQFSENVGHCWLTSCSAGGLTGRVLRGLSGAGCISRQQTAATNNQNLVFMIFLLVFLCDRVHSKIQSVSVSILKDFFSRPLATPVARFGKYRHQQPNVGAC